MEVNKETTKTKNNGIIITIAVSIITLLVGLGCGYLLFNNSTKIDNCAPATEENSETKEEKTEENNTNNTDEQASIPTSDKLIVNLYDGGFVYYIDGGDLYFLKINQIDGIRYFILSHSGCINDNSSAYCKANPEYSRKAVKVEGVDNVKRVKQFNSPHATDESFQAYAVDNDGYVYILRDNKATKVEEVSNVEDLLRNVTDDNNKIEALLKDGTHQVFKGF